MRTRELHDGWAELFSYPPDDVGGPAVRAAVKALTAALPDLADDLAPLESLAAAESTERLQERFTRTFDGTTERALELGWHLWGESYARGAFLVRMRQLLREHAAPATVELPDHLTCALAVLGRADERVAAALARHVVLPALEKLRAGFRDPEDPYARALAALGRFLDAAHPEPAAVAAEGDAR